MSKRKVVLTSGVRTELMMLAAQKIQEAAVDTDLSVKENAYAVAVPLIGLVSKYLKDCDLQESHSDPVTQLFVDTPRLVSNYIHAKL